MGIRLKEIKQKVYKQPINNGQCGQYAVAHLLDLDLLEVILTYRAAGVKNVKGGTTTKQIATGLKALGYHCDERMQIIKPATILPPLCLISIGWYGPPINSGLRRSNAGHWIAYKKGMVICSGAGIYNSLKEYTEQNNGYASAYLEIKKI